MDENRQARASNTLDHGHPMTDLGAHRTPLTAVATANARCETGFSALRMPLPDSLSFPIRSTRVIRIGSMRCPHAQ